MSSMTGDKIKLSIFGESHGAAIGVVIDGLPAGEPVDFAEIEVQMSRRAPGKDKASTKRHESDTPEILSGVLDGHTTGSPLCAVIKNSDAHSSDYDDFSRFPRPGHADFTARARYGGFSDFRGGGHFSGRLTAPMVFAGAVCRCMLKRRGVLIGAHIYSIGEVKDKPFDPVNPGNEELAALSHMAFPVNDASAAPLMRAVIEDARVNSDSVGGIVECAAVGLPCGLGNPIFDGIENRLAAVLFGIPAVKGLEFGAGFEAAHLHGSENNDAFCYEDGKVKTATNRHGGILGGITSGMPVIFRLAFKPTPSIFLPQRTVDLKEECGAVLKIKGRHDPCVVIRAVPVVEALTAVCLLDIMLGGWQSDN
jgi:chorismate synthase